jgi:hypothetical protein
VAVGIAVASPALAQSSWSETSSVDVAPSRRAAQIGFQRDRLAVRTTSPVSYVIVDGYGRELSAQQFARALGDARTYDLTMRSARRQSTVGAVVTSSGPIAMLIGLSRISEGGWNDTRIMEASGYATFMVGMAGTAGGIALLADRRPRRPPTYYDEDQARRLVQAYNRRLLEAYGLSAEEAALVPRAPSRVYARVTIGPSGLVVSGSF